MKFLGVGVARVYDTGYLKDMSTATSTYAVGTFTNSRTGYKTREIHTAGCQDLHKADKVWSPKVQHDTAWSLQKWAAGQGTNLDIAPCAL